MANNKYAKKLTRELIRLITEQTVSSVEGAGSLRDIKDSRDKDSGAYVIDVFLSVLFGYKIPDVAWEVQTKVKEAIKQITDEDIKSINIHIQGVELKEGLNEEK